MHTAAPDVSPTVRSGSQLCRGLAEPLGLARLASWEEVAAVSESPRLTLGNPGSSLAFRDLEIVFGYNVYSRKHRINFDCLGFGSKRR
jgi:hypothetical protein